MSKKTSIIMKNKKRSVKSLNSNPLSSLLDSNFSENFNLSQQLVSYYKDKCIKLEKEYDELLKILDRIKAVCDFSIELQRELNSRNEEVSKLQKIISDLQVHLFREKEENLKISAENDQMRIEDYNNKKKINLLLAASGTCEKKYFHFMTTSIQDKFVPSKLPPRLKKLKEEKQRDLLGATNNNDNKSPESIKYDPQVLLLKNQLLASQLEHHIKISKQQIDVLLKEKKISEEEKKLEIQRLENNLDLLTTKVEKSQVLLCETTEKLIKCQQKFESEKTMWMEEKDNLGHTINLLRDRLGEDIPDIFSNGIKNLRSSGNSLGVGQKAKDCLTEREKISIIYQDQIRALEAEVHRLRERAQICRNTFKEKTEKMTAQVTYLKNKYDDLDRRRHLEAEGFRTDICMLRNRVKELEKKLAKATRVVHNTEQQQLLVSARNTLNRARQLEKELAHMNTKITVLEINEDIRS